VGGDGLVGCGVGQAEVAHLALGDELGHGAHRLLDGHARVGEVDVPEIDRVDPEAPQARLGRGAGALGPGVDPDLVVVGGRDALGRVRAPEHDPPLRGNLDLVAAAGDGPADQPLVVAVGAVGIGRVDERRAGGDRVLQRAHGALVVVVAVHAVDEDHGAVADGGDGQAAGPEGAVREHASMLAPRRAPTNRTWPSAAIGFADRFRRWLTSASCATSSRSPND
jgi:hypothetical protein